MLPILRMAAYAAFLVSFSAAAQTPAAKSGLTDLTYSVQRGKSLFFTGNFQGKPANLVRNGVIGSGKWTIYTGTPKNRVRLILDDRKGLREVLAMDKGHRMTLASIGQERIEYRLYAPNRSFIIGSVLYRNSGRWQLGVMKTEAFPGYSALSDVSDVTEKLNVQSALPAATLARWLQDKWQRFDLIPSAFAQADDNLIRDFFGEKAQAARDFYSAPVHEMFKATLVGAGSVAVKIIATGETVAAGGAITAAAPFLVAVGAGVAIGMVAVEVADWVDHAQLGGSTSARDVFDRLVRASPFDRPAQAEPEMLTSEAAPSASSADFRKLVAMADLVDKQDKLDLRSALDRAEQCSDMNCVTEALAGASKLTRGSGDRMLVFKARERADVRVGLLIADEEIRKNNIARAEQNKQAAAQAAQADEVDQAIQAAIMGVLVDTATKLLVNGVRESAQQAPQKQQSVAPQRNTTQSAPAYKSPVFKCTGSCCGGPQPKGVVAACRK
jgi:hypothetical protein